MCFTRVLLAWLERIEGRVTSGGRRRLQPWVHTPWWPCGCPGRAAACVLQQARCTHQLLELLHPLRSEIKCSVHTLLFGTLCCCCSTQGDKKKQAAVRPHTPWAAPACPCNKQAAHAMRTLRQIASTLGGPGGKCSISTQGRRRHSSSRQRLVLLCGCYVSPPRSQITLDINTSSCHLAAAATQRCRCDQRC